MINMDGHGGRRHGLRLFLLMAIFLLLVARSGIAVPVRSESATPGDCAACHGTAQVLPQGHEPTAEMNAEVCLDCHQKGSPLTLFTKIPLGHLHQLSGVTCRHCHGETNPPEALSTEQCLACHGSLAQVAAKTARVKPHNPHASPHGRTYAACDLCHHQHGTSENFCILCHDFQYVVP